jgi:hypothetical protein
MAYSEQRILQQQEISNKVVDLCSYLVQFSWAFRPRIPGRSSTRRFT